MDKKLLSIFCIFFIFLLVLTPIVHANFIDDILIWLGLKTADNPYYHEENNIAVQWFPIEQGLTEHEYNITVRNLGAEKTINLNLLFANSSYDLKKLGSVRLYEWKQISYQEPIITYKEKSCLDNNVSKKSYNCSIQEIKSYDTKYKYDWVLINGNTLTKTADIFKKEIDTKTLANNNVREFKLKFFTPIEKLSDGNYGSKTQLALEIDNIVYHPWDIATATYRANLTVRNSGGAFLEYPAWFNLDTTTLNGAGKLSSNGSDFWVVNSSGNQIKWVNTTAFIDSNATIWIRHDNLTLNQTYKIYYGATTGATSYPNNLSEVKGLKIQNITTALFRADKYTISDYANSSETLIIGDKSGFTTSGCMYDGCVQVNNTDDTTFGCLKSDTTPTFINNLAGGTIEMWFIRDANAPYDWTFDYARDDAGGGSGAELTRKYYRWAGADITGITSPSQSVWYHMAYTWNTTSYQFYLNGTLQVTGNAGAPYVSGTNLDEIYFAGSSSCGSTYWFGGKMDDIRISSQALSPNELKHDSRIYPMNQPLQLGTEEASNSAPNITEKSFYKISAFPTTSFLNYSVKCLDNEQTNLEINFTWYNNSVKLYSRNVTTTNNSIVDSDLDNGNYTSFNLINVTAVCYDGIDYSSAVMDSVNISDDTPLLNITVPKRNGLYYNLSNQYINITYEIIAGSLSACNITDNGLPYDIFTCGNNYTKTWSEGQHNITISVNDTNGKSRSLNRTFITDLTNPDVNITNIQTSFFTLAFPFNFYINQSFTDNIGFDYCEYNTSENPALTGTTCGDPAINYATNVDGNLTVNLYGYDRSNRTNSSGKVFNINHVQDINASYTDPILEFETSNFILNVTLTNAINISGNITYNGTLYNTTAIRFNSTLLTLKTSITMPDVSTIQVHYFYWNITLNNAQTLNTSTFNQTVNALTGLNLSISCPSGLSPAMCWDFKDESNFTQLTSDQVDYNFQYGTTNTTASKYYGTLYNINSTCICINSTVYNNYTMGYGELKYKKVGFTDRSFYTFSTQRLSNETINNTLYFLANPQATSFLFTVEDSGLNPMNNTYLSLLRWYPSNNSYGIVEMARTDDRGQSVMRVRAEDTDYRVGIYYPNGNLIKLLNPVRFACLSSPCSYNVIIEGTPSDYTSAFKVQSSITYNDTTKIWTLTYNDPTQKTSQMELMVDRLSGDNLVHICNANASGFTGIITCNTTGYNTGTLKATAYRSASPLRVINELFINLVTAAFKNTTGLFIAFIFYILLSLIGIVISPIMALILGVVALVPSYFLGTYAIFIVIGVSVLSFITIHFMRRVSQ